jgi:hypothetical protein
MREWDAVWRDVFQFHQLALDGFLWIISWQSGGVLEVVEHEAFPIRDSLKR